MNTASGRKDPMRARHTAADHGASPPTALSPALRLAFAPLHKRALGVAVGLATGLVILLLTAIPLVRRPDRALNLSLFAQYFYGYSVTWTGALVGFAWGTLVGFVAGWFLAFCRNLVMATSIFLIHTRAELRATRDFLDHL